MKNTNKSYIAAIQCLFFICGVLISCRTFSAPNQEVSVFSQIDSSPVTEILSNSNHLYLAQPDYEDQQAAVRDLYFLLADNLLWTSENAQALATDAFCLLAAASERGLRPEDYDLDFLKLKWQVLQSQNSVQDRELALFDTALSISVLRYLADLQRGRIEARSVGFNFQQQADYDSLILLLIDAVQNGHVEALAEQVEPDYPAYRKLKVALQQFRNLASEKRFPTLLFSKKVEQGYSGPQIEILRRKLCALGFLDAENQAEENLNIYQGELIEAVKRFQRLHGLNDDGVIGKKTLRALNTPLQQRVRQIELALERFRWLPRLEQDKPVVFVNIPAFRLWAYDSGFFQDEGNLSMKVVVGIARKNRTPIFMGKMSYLEFGPYWNVPKNITYDELIPKLRENPDYLIKHNMELVTKFGRQAITQSWSEESLDLLQKGAIKIRQRPGPKNSLGLVKFIFPNRYSVYMHDTPMRRLFKSERRDFSHGCVRVEQPQALAEFMLRDRKGWEAERIQKAMKDRKNKIVSVKADIAVLIFYSTALAIGDEVFFYEDIYGYDEILSEALYQQPSGVSLASIAE